MRFLNAYTKGLKLATSNVKVWLILYALNFLFAFLLAFPFFKYLDSKLAHTMAVDKLTNGFDFTIFNDFLNEYGDIFGFIINQSMVSVFLFLLLSVFTVGGILLLFMQLLQKELQYTKIQTFFRGGSKYYWRLFRLSFYFFIIHLALFLIAFTIFNQLTADGLARFESEKPIWNIGYIVFGIYLFLATIFFMIHDYAKIHIVHVDRHLLVQPFWQSIQLVLKNFPQVFLLYLLNLATFALLYFLYWNIQTGAILLTFLIGQIFIFLRVGMKLLNLGSATALYQEIYG